MTGTDDDRPARERYAGVLDTLRQSQGALGMRDATDLFAGEPPPQAVRRRRGSLTAQRGAFHNEFVLVEEHGVLLWRSAGDVATQRVRQRRRARAGRRAAPAAAGEELARVRLPVLEPNEYMARLAEVDAWLNPDQAAGLRRVVRTPQGQFAAGERVRGPFKGRTLVIVHGTFSHARSIIDGIAGSAEGQAWLQAALGGGYDQVVCFEHPTLSVSPWVNALDLSRQVGATAGSVDIVAHSRGGVVVRWWVEVLNAALVQAGAKVRVFLAGSPLAGTSLAAPDKIQPLVSLLTNIGGLLHKALGAAAATHPFAMAGFGLLRFVGERAMRKVAIPPVGDLGERYSLDAAVAVIPGLQGQSAVSNNAELSRLREHAGALAPAYHAVVANFEAEDPGLRFWRYFRKDVAADRVAEKIFPEANDLVVDTASMTDLGGRGQIPPRQVHRFPDRSGVWHCTYFSQRETIARMQAAFG